MLLCLHFTEPGSIGGFYSFIAQALARHIFVVIQRTDNLDASVDPPVRKDDSIRPHLFTDLFQRFGHAFGKKTFHFHVIASSTGNAVSAPSVLSSACLLAHGRHDRNLFVIRYFLVREHMQPLHTVAGKLGQHRPQRSGYQQNGGLTQHLLALHAVL